MEGFGPTFTVYVFFSLAAILATADRPPALPLRGYQVRLFSSKNVGPPKAVFARIRHQEIQKVKKEKGEIPADDDDSDMSFVMRSGRRSTSLFCISWLVA